MKPTVGIPVHYVSYGTPGGEYTSQCRAAVVTGVPEQGDSEAEVVDLCVFNPSGIFFNRCGHLEPGSPEDLPHMGGTWHWPERADE